MPSILDLIASGGVDTPATAITSPLEHQRQRIAMEQERRLREQADLAARKAAQEERKARREELDEQRMGEAISTGDWKQAAEQMRRTVSPKKYMEFEEFRAKNRKELAAAKLDENKAALERADALGGGIATVEKQPEADRPAVYSQWRGALDEEERANLPEQYPGSQRMSILLGISRLYSQQVKQTLDEQQQRTAQQQADTAELRAKTEAGPPKPTGEYAEFKGSYYPGYLEERGLQHTAKNEAAALAEFIKMKRAAPSRLLTPEEEEQQIRLRKTGRQPTEAEIQRGEPLEPWVKALELGQTTITAVPQAIRGRVFAAAQKQGIAIVSDAEREKMAQLGRAKPILKSVGELSEKINTWNGIIAKARGGVERVKATANLNDDLAEYNSLVLGFTPLVARAVGHTGVLTEQDVISVRALFPKAGDSKSLRDRKIARLERIMGGIQEATEKGILDPVQRGGGSGGGVTVALPDGRTKRFPDQQAADAFKREVGIK